MSVDPHAHRLLIVGPRGQGGVAGCIALVAPHLGGRTVTHLRVGGYRRAVELARDGLAVLRASREQHVVHVHSSVRARALGRDLALLRLVRGPARVVQLHGVDERWLDRLERGGGPRLLRRALGSTTTVLVVSDELAKRLGSIGIEARVVPNPFDPSAVPAVRQVDPSDVLFLGRLVAEKRLPLLIDAFEKVGGAGRLVLAGSGPAEASLRAHVRERGLAERVLFPGWVEGQAKAALLAAAAVVVLPSSSEALPLAMLEALASGVPVVGPATGALPEWVDGAGQLFEPADEGGVERALGAVLRRSPSPERILSAQQRVLREASPSQVARVWSEVYATCARSAG